jgi:transposase
MKKKYIVRLSRPEAAELQELLRRPGQPAERRKRAKALLLADDPGRPDTEIAAIVDLRLHTVTELRKRYSSRGLEGALALASHRRRPKAIDEPALARLVALARRGSSERPPSLRLLASMFVNSSGRRVSHETIRQTLKRSGLEY